MGGVDEREAEGSGHRKEPGGEEESGASAVSEVIDEAAEREGNGEPKQVAEVEEGHRFLAAVGLGEVSGIAERGGPEGRGGQSIDDAEGKNRGKGERPVREGKGGEAGDEAEGGPGEHEGTGAEPVGETPHETLEEGFAEEEGDQGEANLAFGQAAFLAQVHREGGNVEDGVTELGGEGEGHEPSEARTFEEGRPVGLDVGHAPLSLDGRLGFWRGHWE